MSKIESIKGDITKLEVDAIVNAANETLLGGGGVDGAIHDAAGPKLLDECEQLDGCETGEAKITKGHDLPAKYIIHTVGPIYPEYSPEEAARLLKACYQNSLKIAEKYELKSIAFPSISTGVYSYPKEEAAKVALESINEYFDVTQSIIDQVILVSFSNEDKRIIDSVKTIHDEV